MPHSLSAKKRVRQNVRRHQRNRAIKSRIRTATRRFRQAVETGDLDTARERFRDAQRLLHRAANNGPIHRHAAARAISRMQKHLSQTEETAGQAG